jgi:hypothetical protein
MKSKLGPSAHVRRLGVTFVSRVPSALLVLGSWMRQDSAKYSLVFAIYVRPDYGDDDILRNVLPMTDPHMLS